MKKFLRKVGIVLIFASIATTITMLRGWPTLVFSLAIIGLYFLIVRLLRAWSQYQAGRLDKRLMQRAKIHYQVQEYRLYEIASQDSLET